MSETRTAVVLMAYGTPRTPEEILPYYTDIRRGNPPSPEQLADLTARYEAIGGISPLTERTEAQRDALQAALDTVAEGAYRVVLGLKHTAPFIEQTVDSLAAEGYREAVGLVLA
ncbi:MAG: ferrochelatase, partial [Ilumatobacteraceae bacterium]